MTDRERADGALGDEPGAPDVNDDEVADGEILDDATDLANAGPLDEGAEAEAEDEDAEAEDEDAEAEDEDAEAEDEDEDDSEVADDEAEETEEKMQTLDQLIGDDLTRVAAERDEYLDSLQRLQADFDNYRKRASRQQQDLSERASEHIMAALLPVLDTLDLAEAHAATSGDATAESLTQVGTLLRETLRREGLERIDEAGVAFDPTVHDAVAHEAADDLEDGASGGAGSDASDAVNGADGSDGSATNDNTGDASALASNTVDGPSISGVLRAGYRLKGRVLRPAMVKVKG